MSKQRGGLSGNNQRDASRGVFSNTQQVLPHGTSPHELFLGFYIHQIFTINQNILLQNTASNVFFLHSKMNDEYAHAYSHLRLVSIQLDVDVFGLCREKQ